MDIDEITRAFRVRKTVLEMLGDRGFAVEPEETAQTLEEFKAAFCGESGNLDYGRLKIEKTRREPVPEGESRDPRKGPRIVVFFPSEPKLGVSQVKRCYDEMIADKIYSAIVVMREGITSFARTTFARLAAEATPCAVQMFAMQELLVNVTHHTLVPRHILLTPAEKDAVLKRYKVKEARLPRILVSDPVAKYYGLARGDVVKIIRNSETAGRYVTYRLVI